MTVAQLMERLSKLNPNMEVMILDGHNGGGHPREINLGPKVEQITTPDMEAVAECEERLGEEIVILGYGNY